MTNPEPIITPQPGFDWRVFVRSGAIALAAISALLAGFLQAGQLDGVVWAIVIGVLNIVAVFLGDIAGGIAGALRVLSNAPSSLETAAIFKNGLDAPLRSLRRRG